MTYRINSTQKGATLLEAVVALFVFAVGALGVAAMQTTSLVRTDDTKQRTIALWKAQELVDRIRATKTTTDPDGLIAEFVAAIGNTNADNGIGQMTAADEYACTAIATRCDDTSATNAGACTVAQMVAFDIWDVLCEPQTGLATSPGVEGSLGLRNLEVALETNATESRLYFEWLSRVTDQNIDTDGVDTGQVASSGARTVVMNLCGDNEVVDTRLEAYCVRF